VRSKEDILFEVIYDSKTGNTKKVAEAIALALGVTAENVKEKKGLAKGSFVFLGSGCYGARPGKRLQKFIAGHNFQGRQVALFGTSGVGTGDEVRAMEALLKPAGATIKGSFYCKGKMLFAARGHPSQEELASARDFAGRMKTPEK
jgi:flavodoxin I